MFLRKHRAGYCGGLLLMGVFVSTLVVGCSAKPKESDPNQAKRLLEGTLQAWKEGKGLSDLQSQSPPVFVGDVRWQRGAKLTDFKILSDGDYFQSSVRIPVSLRIVGEPKAIEVIYWVSTNPAMSVTLGE